MEATDLENDEAERLYRWRLARYRELRFCDLDAELLAFWRIDWHYVRHLLRDLGYTHEQVMRLV